MNFLELSAILTLDKSKFESGLKEAQGQASSLGGKLVGGMAAVGKITTAAIGATTTAAAGFAKTAIGVGSQFDQSMSQVAATMGVSVDEIGVLRDFAMEMGSSTVFSATQASQALNYMALAGYNVEKSMQMLPQVLNLAAAGNMDLATASDMVTDAETALGLVVDENVNETAIMVDQMAKIASTTNTSVSQLGDAILTVGGTAKFMSGGTKELTSVLGVLADNGIKASEAGTHLRNMILKLSAPTDAGALALKELGVSVFDAEGNMRSFIDIFGDMQKSMSSLTSEEQITMLSDIFNVRDVAAAQALLGTTADRWAEIGAALDSATGSAETMAGTQLDNLTGDITLFKSALEGAQILVSDQLTPSLRQFVQLGSKGLADITKGFQEGGISGAMDAVGGFLSDAVNLIVGNLPKFVDAGVQLLEGLLDGLAKNSGMIMDSIVKVANTIIGAVIKNYPKIYKMIAELITKFAQGITKSAPTLIPAAMDALQTIVDTVIENAPLLIEAAAELIMTLGQGIMDNLPTIINSVYEVISSILNAITDNLPMVLEMGVQLIVALANGLAEKIPDLVPVIINAVMLIVDTLINHASELLDAALAIILALAEGLIKYLPKLVEKLPEIIGSIVEFLTSSPEEIMGAALEIILQLAIGLIKAIPELVLKLPEIIDAIVEGLADGFLRIAEVGARLIEGLWEGIKSMGSWIKNKVEGFADGIIEGFCDVFGISSPSKVMAQLGEYMGEGLGIGWTDAMDEVKKTMNDDLDLEGNVTVNTDVNKSPRSSGGAGTDQSTGSTGGDTVVPIYIGGELIEELVIDAKRNITLRSGGLQNA